MVKIVISLGEVKPLGVKISIRAHKAQFRQVYQMFKMYFISTPQAVTERRRKGRREEEQEVMNHSKINMSTEFVIAWEMHLDWRIAVHGFHPSPHPETLGVSLLTDVDGHSSTRGCCRRNKLRAAEGHSVALFTFLGTRKARPQGPGGV